MMFTPSAVVVGAGAGGVAVAARLAKNGFRVTVLEKNASIGGRCSLLHKDGYRFDQGPSLLLMPEFFSEIFEDLGTTLEEEGVQLLKCEPNYRIWFADQQFLDLSSDMAHMKREIESREGPLGFERFLDFLRESGRHYQLSCQHVLRMNFYSVWSMLRPTLMLSLRALHPFESLYGRASRHFRSETLRRAFTFASMYLGMSPYDAPGTYSLLQYTEFADGIWYPLGGFQTVLEALGKVGARFGVKFRFNCPVASVQLSDDQRTASGVVLDSGETINADVVIINADLTYAYSHLLPPSRFAESLRQRGTSCSSISFFWSFNTKLPALQVHNIFLADEYRQSFDAIFQDNHFPTEPSFYVHVPSRLDPTASPEGTDALVVLVPVGHLGNETTAPNEKCDPDYWESVVSKIRQQVLHAIEGRTGISNLGEKLISEETMTPLKWRNEFNLDRGAILGLSHSFFNVLSFRPKTRHAQIDGLFFVGASTHPGTGVPVCLAGSKIVCEQVMSVSKGKSSGGLASLWYIWGCLAMIMGLVCCIAG